VCTIHLGRIGQVEEALIAAAQLLLELLAQLTQLGAI
jgi:hypothetical protein